MNEIQEQIKNNPLTYEEAKEQFEVMTKELGIKHAFEFDDMWRALELVKRQREFDEKIGKAYTILRKNGLSKAEIAELNPVDHEFCDGLYKRRIFNPAGSLIVTKIHNQENMFFLLEGEMTVVTEKDVEYIKAPYEGITPVGAQRVIYSHTDCVFVTVHATEERDIEKLEETIATEPSEMPILEDGGVQAALKVLLGKKKDK